MSKMPKFWNAVILLCLFAWMLGCPPAVEPGDDAGSDAAVVSDAAGIDAVGTDATGIDAAGTDATGADAAGTDAAGTDAAGTDAAGTDAAGTDAAGTDGAGSDAAQADAAGSDAGPGPCQSADECPVGEGCRTATGDCDTCRLASECSLGEACRDGVCTTCEDSVECGGGICDNGTCRTCVASSDDALCQSEYGDSSFSCRDDGTCAPTTCTSGTDCQIIAQVCSLQGICVDCTATSECLDDLRGRYGSGTLCVDGSCVEANCADSTGCPEDRPICGDNFRCRACDESQECLDAAGVSSGYVCDTEIGRCEAGDCYPNGAPCNPPSGGVCEDYSCRSCNNVEGATLDDCQQNGYGDSVLCLDGSCITAQCNDVQVCEFGRLCDNGICIDCNASDDSYCTGQGMTCNTLTESCVGCTDNSQCAEGQRICEDNECRDCFQGECATGRVCAAGACLAGDCYIDGQIWDHFEAKQDDVCSRCNRVVTRFAWSPNPGVLCNDDNLCSYSDTCSPTIAGACDGQSYICTGNTCADGVCHGTGSGDCTLEKKTSWNGCFIDGGCYAHLDDNPGNPCQYCDGATGEWADRTEGIGCGNCRTCQTGSSGIICDFAPDGTDPNSDCTLSCQVCNSTGGCRWADASSDPDNNCTWSPVVDCQLNGECAGSSENCAYWTDGQGQVDDGKECTINDRCDGSGHKIGDNVDDGTLCASGTSICRGGDCTPCQNTPECGDGKVCSAGGLCVVGTCNVPGDCGTPPLCQKWTCPGNDCVPVADDAASCSDDDPCTLGDRCLDSACDPGTDTPVCDSASDVCNDGICVKLTPSTYECRPSPKTLGTVCTTDSWPCTVEKCDGGAGSDPGVCEFDSISAGQCLIGGVCRDDEQDNPAEECEKCDADVLQTDWVAKLWTDACSADTLYCTADHCSGFGSCLHDWDSGTSTCLESDACFASGVERSTNECEVCSGSNTWDPKTAGSVCDDEDSSTDHDICMDSTCQDRFVVWVRCFIPGVGYSCVNDITTGKYFYAAPTACDEVKTFAEARDICDAASIFTRHDFKLPTANQLEELSSPTARSGCDDPVYIDGDISSQVNPNTTYWTYTCVGSCLAPPAIPSSVYTVDFSAAAPTRHATTTTLKRGVICIEY